MAGTIRSVWDGVVLVAFAGFWCWCLLRYVRLAYWSLKKLRGVWRIFTLLPVLVVAPSLIGTMWALVQGYNGWVFVLLLAVPYLCLYQGLAVRLREWFQRR